MEHWKPISRVKYEAYNTELETAQKELSSLEMALIAAVSAVENETKAHGKLKRKLSRQLVQAQQSLRVTEEKLEQKNALEREMSAHNKQLTDENQALRLSVAEYSRKVVHVCKGRHHIEFNATIHRRALDGSTPLHWYHALANTIFSLCNDYDVLTLSPFCCNEVNEMTQGCR